MKALIRKKNEVILETTTLEFIDWATGAPLTNAAWCGGPYTLVNDYVAETKTYTGEAAEDVVVRDDTVLIDGKKYTKAELRALLGE